MGKKMEKEIMFIENHFFLLKYSGFTKEMMLTPLISSFQ